MTRAADRAARRDEEPARRAGVRTGRWLLPATAGLLSFFFACQESLPPRNDPGSPFDGIIRTTYVYAPNENDVHFTVGLVNTFDETLQDTADLHGKLMLTMLRRPTVTRVLDLSVDSLLPYQRAYDPSTHLLTLDPGDTLWLRARWDMRDQRGRDLTMDEFRFYTDVECRDRAYSYEEDFVVVGYVQVFPRNGQVALAPTKLRLCYVYPYVGPSFCPKPSAACMRWN